MNFFRYLKIKKVRLSPREILLLTRLSATNNILSIQEQQFYTVFMHVFIIFLSEPWGNLEWAMREPWLSHVRTLSEPWGNLGSEPWREPWVSHEWTLSEPWENCEWIIWGNLEWAMREPWVSHEETLSEPWKEPWMSHEGTLSEPWENREWTMREPWVSHEGILSEPWGNLEWAMREPWVSHEATLSEPWGNLEWAMRQPWAIEWTSNTLWGNLWKGLIWAMKEPQINQKEPWMSHYQILEWIAMEFWTNSTCTFFISCNKNTENTEHFEIPNDMMGNVIFLFLLVSNSQILWISRFHEFV